MASISDRSVPMFLLFLILAFTNMVMADDSILFPFGDVVGGEHIPHWDEAPSSLADYRLLDNRTIIDPWLYTERLGLFKILLNATSSDPTLGEANNTANVLWGLPLQHGWQFSSGRLQDFSNATVCSKDEHADWNRISPCSWWASMNYYLSVVPFLGAVDAGVFANWPHEIILSASPYRPDDFCTSLKQCTSRFPTLIKNWAIFFKNLKYRLDAKTTHHHNKGGDTVSPKAPPPTLSPRESDIIGKLWIAHTDSVDVALHLFNTTVLSLMPQPEQTFGLSWANIINYIAAVDFVTDLNTTVSFQEKYLPVRVLQRGDAPPDIPDFTRDVNLALYILENARSVDYQTGDALKRAWQALMCSEASRSRGRYLMSNLLKPLQAGWTFVVIMWLYVTQCL